MKLTSSVQFICFLARMDLLTKTCILNNSPAYFKYWIVSVMARINWKILKFFRGLIKSILFQFSIVKLTFLSLIYNDFADWYYIGDTLMEPMFWFVDHFTKILGPICVAGVLILGSSIIAIAYIIGLPFYIRWNTFMLILGLVIGHWLLINVIFYYYMAFTTEPGYPPQGAMIIEAVSICKRCIAPKPPRTHHCSVCNRCILKMDHHCPWLNNCIGHFNHRYFFMFCIYAWCGVTFIMVFGIPVAYDHFFGDAKQIQETQINSYNMTSNTSNIETTWPKTLYHSCIIYSALFSIAVFFVLGGLIAWHARLILRGETSIESHINKKERMRFQKENKIYKNPYDFGPVKNWKIFLCIGDHRPWWHILLPFAEAPPGDGLQWNFYNCLENDHSDKKESSKSFSLKI